MLASRQTATAPSFSLFIFLSCLGGVDGLAYLVAYKEGFLSTNPLKISRECICMGFSFLFFLLFLSLLLASFSFILAVLAGFNKSKKFLFPGDCNV